MLWIIDFGLCLVWLFALSLLLLPLACDSPGNIKSRFPCRVFSFLHPLPGFVTPQSIYRHESNCLCTDTSTTTQIKDIDSNELDRRQIKGYFTMEPKGKFKSPVLIPYVQSIISQPLPFCWCKYSSWRGDPCLWKPSIMYSVRHSWMASVALRAVRRDPLNSLKWEWEEIMRRIPIELRPAEQCECTSDLWCTLFKRF